MKILYNLIYLLILLLIFSCQKENENDPTEFINYPEYTDYGENILFQDKIYIEDNRNYSMAVNLPENNSIRVILKGGIWNIPLEERKDWSVFPYNNEDQLQIFESVESGKECDLKIYFAIPNVRDTFMWNDSLVYDYNKGIRDTITVEYYENMSDLPTGSKTIFIERNKLRDDLSATEFKDALIGEWRSVYEHAGKENVVFLNFDDQGKAEIILEKDGINQEYSGDYTVDFIREPAPKTVTMAEITISSPEKEIVLSLVNFGLHNAAYRLGIFLRIDNPPYGVLERVATPD